MSKSSRYMREEISEDSLFSDDEDDYFDKMAVFDCIKKRDTAKLRNIIDRGLHLDVKNTFGDSPLSVEVSERTCPSDDNTEILDLLLYFGCPLRTQNRFGETALHIAARWSAVYLERLLQAGSAVNATDNAGRTPLMLACNSRNDKSLIIVQYLLDFGAWANCKDNDGMTALHYLCMKREGEPDSLQAEIMYRLLYAGADVSVISCTDYTAAMYLNCLWAQTETGVGIKNTLLRIITRGGSNLIKEQLCLFQKKREFMVPKGVDYSIFEPVTRKSVYKKMYREITWAYPNLAQHSDFVKGLKASLKREQTLKELARLVIRDRLGGQVFCNADKLGLPTTLVDYVTYLECNDV